MDQILDILVVGTPTIALAAIATIKIARGTPVYSRKGQEVGGNFWGAYPRKALAATEPSMRLPTISKREYDFSERDNVPHSH